MKLKVFQANKGDTLLVTGEDGTTLLVDGGLIGSYRDHLRPALEQLAASGTAIDLVCVSHIDEDHIAGILQLLDDILEWRVFRFQESQVNDAFDRPSFGELPEVLGVWHNSFEAQTNVVSEEVEEILTTQIQTSFISGENETLIQSHQSLINSKRQALALSHRLSQSQLGTPLNAPFNGQPVVLDDQPLTEPLGSMTLQLLGPFRTQLEDLEQDWDEWVRDNQETIRQLQREAEEDAAELHLDEAETLRLTVQLLATELGERGDVTVPNLASIMFLVQEDGSQILFTGDGFWEDILQGLRLQGLIDDDAGIHVDVMKLQHHGAEANIHADFCKLVTADHYVICANGSDDNPELVVLDLIVDSRLGTLAAESKSPGVNRPFKLWFNSSETAANTVARKAHMAQVKAHVAALAANSGGHLTFSFLENESSFEIAL
jgi:beta-lactamase superfamily II metal-dependent hydrolase